MKSTKAGKGRSKRRNSRIVIMKSITETLIDVIDKQKPRSAWKKGVKLYAIELLNEFANDDWINNWPELFQNTRNRFYSSWTLMDFRKNYLRCLEKELLNGAANWKEYSYGGCSLIYDADIAERLCTPSELKRTKNGKLQPNKKETWIDVQARALHQAWYLITESRLRGDLHRSIVAFGS